MTTKNAESITSPAQVTAQTRGKQSRQFLLFLVMGGLAALVNFFSRMAFSHWMHYTLAIILAYLYGMINAFILNRLFVFRHAVNQLHHQVFWFMALNFFALAQTLLVSLLLSELVFPHLRMTWNAKSGALHWRAGTRSHQFSRPQATHLPDPMICR